MSSSRGDSVGAVAPVVKHKKGGKKEKEKKDVSKVHHKSKAIKKANKKEKERSSRAKKGAL